MILIISSAIIYSYFYFTFYVYLEKRHSELIEELNLPRKINPLMITASFNQGIHFLKFVYDLDNPDDKKLKLKKLFLIISFWFCIFTWILHAMS